MASYTENLLAIRHELDVERQGYQSQFEMLNFLGKSRVREENANHLLLTQEELQTANHAIHRYNRLVEMIKIIDQMLK